MFSVKFFQPCYVLEIFLNNILQGESEGFVADCPSSKSPLCSFLVM